ncbi:MAG: alpha-amylase family glycosyl hydrolase [Arcanobacterium sp.]
MTGELIHAGTTPTQWWQNAVIYQIYPRSFATTKGGIGNLAGITERLDHIAKLGADAVWLSPFYLSPQKDAGYDVADYRQVDPLFGTNEEAFALFDRAHELGLKVIVDLVPNHTSDAHKWFQAALAGGPDAPERDLYYFRPGRGEDGIEPPNNWTSVFHGPAWSRVKDRADAPGSTWENDDSWYLHMFDSSQPDLNWENPQVRAEFADILRFWLERGVDGFRVDVAHGLVKDPALPDWEWNWNMVTGGTGLPEDAPRAPMWDQDGVHEIYRQWRGVLDEFGPDRMLVAEAWVETEQDLAKYVRSDEMSQSFNFAFLATPFAAQPLRTVITSSLQAMDAVGAPTTWVLSNHDVVRATSRMGLKKTGKGPMGFVPAMNNPM